MGKTNPVIKTLCPKDYNEALYVGHYFRTGNPVVMDLTALPDSQARQFVDFAAGLVFGRGGDMDRLSHKVFLLMPHGMTKTPPQESA
ncbi:FtsZ-interacting cell division protein YlmF [Streptosporangium saharense]|uniref:FtsZ-interacting cell division protein YlmF n=1 Tax=Streptosporangium saharense TaxID=1706840 RepID=A0A7W7VSC8_9ACTN|nr:FtsZ-interacting cell division protein YlmF [Streptosporangium saharense]